MAMRWHRIFPALLLTVLLAGCGRPGPILGPAPAPKEGPTAQIPAQTPAQADGDESAAPAPEPSESGESPTAVVPAVIPPEDALVRVVDHIPHIAVELKYATEDNFTGAVIYDFSDAYLRYGTVRKLAQVQDALEERGMGLKIWDAYRPVAAQFRLWEVCPDPTYVANPNTGFSSHSRGNTVDVTLVDAEGGELSMPTGFDDFSPLADRDYSDCEAVPADNARLLEELMKEHGFKPYAGEWWHFTDSTAYGVENDFSQPEQG